MKNIIFNSIIDGQGLIIYQDTEANRLEVYLRNLKTIKDNLLQTLLELCLNPVEVESYYVHAPELDQGSVREIVLAIQSLQKKMVIISSTFKAENTLDCKSLSPISFALDYQRALNFLIPNWATDDTDDMKVLKEDLDVNEGLRESITEIFPESEELETVGTEQMPHFDEEQYQRKFNKEQNGYDFPI